MITPNMQNQSIAKMPCKKVTSPSAVNLSHVNTNSKIESNLEDLNQLTKLQVNLKEE